MSNAVSVTVNGFIDYALIIVTLLIAWYVIKFFLVQPPTKEEREAALQGQREAWKGMTKKMGDKARERHEEESRKRYKQMVHNHSRAIINNLKYAFSAADRAIRSLDRKDSPAAQRAVKEFDEELHNAWGNLRLLRGKVQSEDKPKVNDLLAAVQANRDDLTSRIGGKIPRKVDANWDATTPPIRATLVHIRGSSGAIFDLIDSLAE